MTSGPWPRVTVKGRLDSAESEWVHTNGAGAFSMSTVAMMHTRRYHGMFIAALRPPFERCCIVSHMETKVVSPRQTYRLSTHQFPGIAPTPGYRYLQYFAQDPLPRWVYRLGKGELERKLCLARGRNALVLSYLWSGRGSVRLTLRPLMPMRDIHTLTREHPAMVQRIRMRPGLVQIRPVKRLPAVVFGHPGLFVGSPDWYRRFEYSEDKERGVACEEDQWTPGVLEIPLEPEKPAYVVIALDELPEASPEELLEETRDALQAVDPGYECTAPLRRLHVAAEAYCVDRCEYPSVIAGYPWYDVETRDLLMSVPGLYLVRGEVRRAREVLATVVESARDGLLPRRLHPAGQEAHTFPADVSLWLFETVRLFARLAGTGNDFVRGVLYPALGAVFDRLRSRRHHVAWITRDGLIENGDEGYPLTWMDARLGNQPTTPRRGLAVELQALWSRACETLAVFAREYGDEERAGSAESACLLARAAFRRRFWCARSRYPYDCIRDSPNARGAVADDSVRPNALIALDVDPKLFERWQAAAIVEKVRSRLLTPRGIRSLDPDDPAYRGAYTGDYVERRAAYHQGIAWTHLLGCYARAELRLDPDNFELQEDLRELLEGAAKDGPVLGHVSQFADGEPPFRPGGCPAQAWSVAELLRTLAWDLDG